MVLGLAAGSAFAADSLKFEDRRFNRDVSGCTVKFDWIEVTSGPVALRGRINAAIQEAFFSSSGDLPAPRTTYKKAADDFISECRKEKDSPNPNWSLAENVTVQRDRPPVFSFEYRSDVYDGGAHPNSNTWYLNLDAETGRRVELASILSDGFPPRLTEIAERHFRAVRNLSPTANLKEEGFWWQDGRFDLNENYAIGETSLIFFYNTYEIASHADGPTRVEIPYAEIQDLLKPNFRKSLGASAPRR
jgi:hypothetical protein